MFNSARYMALDFETYSDVDLPKQGLDNYVNGKYFQVLIAGLAWWDQRAGDIQTHVIDFVNTPYDQAIADLRDRLQFFTIVAHNAAFERAVLAAIGIDLPASNFIDTAVLARAAGYGGSLEAASAQALNEDKVAAGKNLIKQYCIPSEKQVEENNLVFNAIHYHSLADWKLFKYYCEMDAVLSLKLVLDEKLHMGGFDRENQYSALTMEMNTVGWHVDTKLVRVMNEMYKRNVDANVEAFRTQYREPELNFNSTQQMIAWCKDRGVTVSSFDEKAVASLKRRLIKRIEPMDEADPKKAKLREVLALANVKQVLGGSSLKKLDVIERTVSADGRLRHQYMHVGAGATFRTTGRGVQMQNLKRLHGNGGPVEDLLTVDAAWDNDMLSENLRQCFTASDPQGFLIVGDFSSVESRGLAWQSGEKWKLAAYALGEDLYKVQAGQMFGVPKHIVTKEQRQIGKVAELSCGYGAGAGAVKDFAAKMGVDLSEAEAAKLVRDWREANPNTVEYWAKLDAALREALAHGTARVQLPYGWVAISTKLAPASLRAQTKNPRLMSIYVDLVSGGKTRLSRVIHGVSEDGRSLIYWKPSERKNGDLWVDRYTDPKTKRMRKYSIYGGKLAGLLTQSLCREIFFVSLTAVNDVFNPVSNVDLVGQFHDEIVLDFVPGHMEFDQTMLWFKRAMETCELQNFPLAADIKHAYRYIK